MVKAKHKVSYVSGGGHSDQYACACGWKSNGYWDLAEAAWDEWLLHAHDVGTKIEVEHRDRQTTLVRERAATLARLRRERSDIDRQIKKLARLRRVAT